MELVFKQTVTHVYDFMELSRTAKDKAISDYYNFLLDTGILANDVTEMMEDRIENLYPHSSLKVQWSLSSCQGDGVNVYGDLAVEDVLNNAPENMFSDKERRTLEWYENNSNSFGEMLRLPMNGRYCYCVVSHIDDADDIYYNMKELESIRGVNLKLLKRFNTEIVRQFEGFCYKLERMGYRILEMDDFTDGEMADISEANDWQYLEDGSMYNE